MQTNNPDPRDPPGHLEREYVRPLLEVLKAHGNSASRAEAVKAVIEWMNLPRKEVEVLLNDGQSRVKTYITWARWYLVKSGYIDDSRRGIWTLTEKGQHASLSEQDVLEMMRGIDRHTRMLRRQRQR